MQVLFVLFQVYCGSANEWDVCSSWSLPVHHHLLLGYMWFYCPLCRQHSSRGIHTYKLLDALIYCSKMRTVFYMENAIFLVAWVHLCIKSAKSWLFGNMYNFWRLSQSCFCQNNIMFLICPSQQNYLLTHLYIYKLQRQASPAYKAYVLNTLGRRTLCEGWD